MLSEKTFVCKDTPVNKTIFEVNILQKNKIFWKNEDLKKQEFFWSEAVDLTWFMLQKKMKFSI